MDNVPTNGSSARLNHSNGSVVKDELMLLISLLKKLDMEKTVDKFTNKMAQSEHSPVDAFRDVLGDEKTEETGKKRKTIMGEQSQTKKGRVVMKQVCADL